MLFLRSWLPRAMQWKNKTPSCLSPHKFLSPPPRSVTLNLLKARSLRRKNCASPQGFGKDLHSFAKASLLQTTHQLHFVIAVYEKCWSTQVLYVYAQEWEWMNGVVVPCDVCPKDEVTSNCWVKCRGGVGRSFILPSLQFRDYQTTNPHFRRSCLFICCVPLAKISFTHKRLHRPSKQGQSGNPCKKPSWLPAPSVMNEGTLSHFHERVWSVPWLST